MRLKKTKEIRAHTFHKNQRNNHRTLKLDSNVEPGVMQRLQRALGGQLVQQGYDFCKTLSKSATTQRQHGLPSS